MSDRAHVAASMASWFHALSITPARLVMPHLLLQGLEVRNLDVPSRMTELSRVKVLGWAMSRALWL